MVLILYFLDQGQYKKGLSNYHWKLLKHEKYKIHHEYKMGVEIQLTMT